MATPRHTFADAGYVALLEAGEGLHYRVLTRVVLECRLYRSEGKTPDQTLRTQIAREAKSEHSRFVLLGGGYIDLTPAARSEPDRALIDSVHRYAAGTSGATEVHQPTRSSSRSGTFADAAYKYLLAHRDPMHYRELAEAVISAGEFESRGKTPDQTLRTEIAREVTTRGSSSRFALHSHGVVSLSEFGSAGPVPDPSAPVPLRLRTGPMATTATSSRPGPAPAVPRAKPVGGAISVEGLVGSQRFLRAYDGLTRIKPPMDQIVAALRVLFERSGRVTKAALGNATGTPPLRLGGLCVALQKIFNREDSRVLVFDPVSDTLSLDVQLLAEIFLTE